MAKNITVTLPDGRTHTYEDVPDYVTQEQAQARAAQEFGVRSAPKPVVSNERTISDQIRTLPQDMARQLALTGRNIVTGATAIPGIFADATMAGYNLLTGGNQQMPTEALQAAMTRMGVPRASRSVAVP